MSVELARRLLKWGVAPAEVEAALAAALAEGESLIAVIARQSPHLLDQIERELAGHDLPSIEMVRTSPELAAELPEGMCDRLIAVPVHRDPRTGRVDVAAADAFDPHLHTEFGYHLGAPVRVLRARYAAVAAALSTLRERRAALPATDRKPALASPITSERPLPLVRKPSTEGREEAQAEAEAVPDSVPEPVLSLSRAKGPGSAPVTDEQRVLHALEHSVAPEEVLELCVTGLEPMLVVALALRGSTYEARAASPELGEPERVRKLRLPVDRSSVLETAVKQGYYLGALPATPAHSGLGELFPAGSSEEVYVAPISVSGRFGVALVAARLGPTAEATRRIDAVASAAGQALTRILRNRKRSTR